MAMIITLSMAMMRKEVRPTVRTERTVLNR